MHNLCPNIRCYYKLGKREREREREEKMVCRLQSTGTQVVDDKKSKTSGCIIKIYNT